MVSARHAFALQTYQFPIIFTMRNKASPRLWIPLSLPISFQTQSINVRTASSILYHVQCASGTWLCCCFRVRFLQCVFLTFFLYLTPCSNDAQNVMPSAFLLWNTSYVLVSIVFVRITVLPCNLMLGVFSPHSWSFRRTKSFPIFAPLDI